MEIASRANERRKEEQKTVAGGWLSPVADAPVFTIIDRFSESFPNFLQVSRYGDRDLSSALLARIREFNVDYLIVCRRLIHEWNYRGRTYRQRWRDVQRGNENEKTKRERRVDNSASRRWKRSYAEKDEEERAKFIRTAIFLSRSVSC